MWANYKNREPLPRFPLWLRIVWPIALLIGGVIVYLCSKQSLSPFVVFLPGVGISLLGYLCLLLSETKRPPRVLFIIIFVISIFGTLFSGIGYFMYFINNHPEEQAITLMFFVPALFTLIASIIGTNPKFKSFWADLLFTLIPVVPMVLIGLFYTKSNIVIFIIVTVITLLCLCVVFPEPSNDSSSYSSYSPGLSNSQIDNLAHRLGSAGFRVEVESYSRYDPRIRLVSRYGGPISTIDYEEAVKIASRVSGHVDDATIKIVW